MGAARRQAEHGTLVTVVAKRRRFELVCRTEDVLRRKPTAHELTDYLDHFQMADIHTQDGAEAARAPSPVKDNKNIKFGSDAMAARRRDGARFGQDHLAAQC